MPGKPLALIAGRPLLQWVWERAVASGAASVVVATDDARVRTSAAGFGADCVMTEARHHSGTDRVAEVARTRAWGADAIVVNLQGDEPLIDPRLITSVATALADRPEFDIATAVSPIQSLAEFRDPNCVKALRAEDGRALYFSRAAVPWPRDALAAGEPASFDGAWRHIGIYGFRVHSLLRFAAWAPTPLERIEKLEQLRALERGMSIYLVELAAAPPAGVDTPADLERVRALFEPPKR